jgi:hypothetical protein
MTAVDHIVDTMRFMMYARMMGYEFVPWDDFEEEEGE